MIMGLSFVLTIIFLDISCFELCCDRNFRSIFLFSLHMHSIFNGVNYKYIKSISDKKRRRVNNGIEFFKKTRKIVASLLAVAILLGVLPVSGLTGNSSGAESSSSENSTKTIYVNSTKQPILFDSVGNFKEIIPKVKKNIYSTEAENGDKIALFTDIGNGNSVVFYKTTEWTPSAYMWKEDSSENPDKNAAWPGEAMKKYGDSNSSLYYYVYGSAKGFDKVIF